MEKIAENWFKYKDNLYEALDNEFIRIALRRAIKSFRTNRDKAIQRYPEVEEKRKKLKERKFYIKTSNCHIEVEYYCYSLQIVSSSRRRVLSPSH